MPMASMSALWQRDMDRNAYRVRKVMMPMLRASTRKSRHVRDTRAVVQFTFQRARTEQKKRQRSPAPRRTTWISKESSKSGGPVPLACCRSRMPVEHALPALGRTERPFAAYSFAAPCGRSPTRRRG
jgi:hypothetical protein